MKRGSSTMLRWALAGLTLAALPHLDKLPLWVTGLLFSALGWRLLGAYRGWRLPVRSIKWAAAVTALVLVFINFKTINGLEAGSALLVAMLALKVLETTSRRDMVALVLSAYFLTIASLLYSQSIPALIYAFGAVWIISAALVQVSMEGPGLSAKRTLKLSGAMLVQSLPIMFFLFLLFPRIPTPLVGLSNSGVGRTGLSEEMRPGTITNLIQSDSVAFTVRFQGEAPAYSDLYWRGPVLHDFDGAAWSRRGWVGARRQINYETRGPALRYTVTLEPNQRNWLFALDVPTDRPRGSQLLWDYQMVHRYPIAQVFRYEVASHLDHALDRSAPPRSYALSLHGNNQETLRFAEELKAENPDPDQYIAAVLSHFAEQAFFYTLTPPGLDMRAPVDDFLFNSRAGFCEHYASAFAVLMRAGGIPSRVVTGYLGGEFNPITGYMTVRNSEAHAWTEVWLPDQGWTRIDPTAAVAPERIQDGLANAIATGETLPGSIFRSNQFLLRVRYGYDALNMWWNDFVLGYGPDAQKSLLKWLGFANQDWRYLTAFLTISLVMTMSVLWFLLMRQIRPRQRDQIVQWYRRFCEKLEKTGITRKIHEGPQDFARRVAVSRPAIAQETLSISQTYIKLRYEPQQDNDLVEAFKRQIKSFKPST